MTLCLSISRSRMLRSSLLLQLVVMVLFIVDALSSRTPCQREVVTASEGAFCFGVWSTFPCHRRSCRHSTVLWGGVPPPLTPSSAPSPSEHALLTRTAKQLQRLQQQQQQQLPSTAATPSQNESGIMHEEQERLYQQYLQQSANQLKAFLEKRELSTKGRKPDMARRLALDDLQQPQQPYEMAQNAVPFMSNNIAVLSNKDKNVDSEESDANGIITQFAGLKRLSTAAQSALTRAQFTKPSPIQAASIRSLWQGHSALLHAPTGSGKTLAYLLPITERLWQAQGNPSDTHDSSFYVIVTPTRELAAQVAGIATVLAPPGSVRLVSHPTDLLSDGQKDRGFDNNAEDQGRIIISRTLQTGPPSLIVGSAKSIWSSLYGTDKMPAAPTPKPAAMFLLQHIRCLVLDEVDRLLAVSKTRGERKKKKHNTYYGGGHNNKDEINEASFKNKKNNNNNNNHREDMQQHLHIHERPAAMLCAVIQRRSIKQPVQVIAVSATVGRPLKRELARVMGLLPQQCPPVIRGMDNTAVTASTTTATGTIDDDHDDDDLETSRNGLGMRRLVSIPETVQHYVVPAEGDSDGSLLTTAYQVIQQLGFMEPKDKKILLVLTKHFGIHTHNVIGALRHFRCQPEPQSLIDVLQQHPQPGTNAMMEMHRLVSGATGIGESMQARQNVNSNNDNNNNNESAQESSHLNSYLLVTGEDSIRGLHLDGLDIVLVLGRPQGPDEYIHIAGRTGRAGRYGTVINIVNGPVATLSSWESMLGIQFQSLSVTAVSTIVSITR